jgi:glycine/D-amino acid oxidase-like deaminating enzyme
VGESGFADVSLDYVLMTHQTGIMAYTESHDPFVSAIGFHCQPRLTPFDQVGPVRDEKNEPVAGQWIAAGFSGHGMPRTFLRYITPTFAVVIC